MIIKSKRIKARGPALKRALRHITNVEDNDAVELIYGNVADLEDARDDALRFGREYAVRHWILSPGEPISNEQLTELVARLAAEFCFDPKRIVIWRHTKDRATDDGCKEHFHLCVPETDPLTGGVMSSSHDWRRHEKLARTVEILWGHRVVPGAHAAAVLVALGKEIPTDAENALRDIAPADHPQSFDEKAHQRLKRQGYDLPRLREMISDSLSAATDRTDFDARLSILGLRIRTGDRADVPIIETADDGTFVGSLARLTRLRKNALKERMKFNATGQSTAQTDHPRSHVSSSQAPLRADGAHFEASGGHRSSRPAAPDGHHDHTFTRNHPRDRERPRPAGKSGSPAGRTNVQEAVPERHSWLRFAAGCIQHESTLLDLLGTARRSARPPFDRTLSDLNDIIEAETLAMNRTASLKEPASLHAAWRKAEEAAAQLRSIDAQIDDVLQKLADGEPRRGWLRVFGPSHDPEMQALESRLAELQRQFLVARGECAASRQALKTEQREFQIANDRHQANLVSHRAQADDRIATARAARKLIEQNPRFARWGAGAVLRVTMDIQKARADVHIPDAPSDWDLVPTFDLWGIPHLPPPKVP